MLQLPITTTQNELINFKAASVGDRLLAYFIDLLIKIAYVIVIAIVFFSWLDITRYFNTRDQWSVMAVFIILFFPVIVYTVTLESILGGQTFGKKIVKIKVVKLDGYQASFGDFLMRWFFRIIDISLMSGIIGTVLISVSKKQQRLGDMVAGTAVVNLKNDVNISHTILEEIGNEYVPTYPLVIKLSDNDLRIIKESLKKYETNHDYDMLSLLVSKIESVTGIKNASESKEKFVKTILKDYNFYTQNM